MCLLFRTSVVVVVVVKLKDFMLPLLKIVV